MTPGRDHTDVAAMFAGIADAAPERPALRWSSTSATSYRDFDRLSNQLARVLIERGVRKRDTVCIAIDKCPVAYGAMLASLKIGAAYFAIDPSNPPARIRAILDRCRPSAAFIGTATQPALFDCAALLVDEAQAGPAWLRDVDDRPVVPEAPVDGSDPAYVMFTSGSTGTPKGVTISHANLLHFIGWTARAYDTRASDVFSGVNPLFFDNSVFDFYASLFAGASLAPVTARMLKEPAETLRHLEDLGCTVYFSVPSLIIYFQRLKLIHGGSFPALRAMIFGGEGFPKPMLARLHEHLGARVALHNVYGPTECTCICSSHQVTAADLTTPDGYAPLGRLAPTFSGVIVDETGNAVADGETGELCLGGPCVGLGYYRDPEQSARVFVQNPTHDRFFDRMYRTGDRVRLDPSDRLLHFAGRADTQIKLQGYRIELAEIEHALAAHGSVEEAAAVYVSTAAAGRIVAVVASHDRTAVDGIKTLLAARLPRYMIPERIVVVDQLPKNANGKVDRKAIGEAIAAGNL